jgi:aminoglycoside phosphotransferase (APT) family kinase protein
MATIGDPLADLGWLLRDWGIVPTRGIRNPAKALSALPGFPSADEMEDIYRRESGIEVRDREYYEIFAMWKETIIAEGLYASYLAGTAANPSVARFKTEVPEQIERTLEKIGRVRRRNVL